uniref:Uncharacterized protein n=1 Tax=Romanomermis culicivorax TaxID=13658 RepID=A0A915K442_ROMCU
MMMIALQRVRMNVENFGAQNVVVVYFVLVGIRIERAWFNAQEIGEFDKIKLPGFTFLFFVACADVVRITEQIFLSRHIIYLIFPFFFMRTGRRILLFVIFLQLLGVHCRRMFLNLIIVIIFMLCRSGSDFLTIVSILERCSFTFAFVITGSFLNLF